MKILTKIAVVIVLPFSISANAGFITDFEGTGVDFYSSWLDADTLRIEIDAGSITTGSGWDGATKIDSIAINGPWSWQVASDITLVGPVSTTSGFSGGVDGTGLDANGCQGLSLGKNHQCWTGLADLQDDMLFDFTFSSPSLISFQTDSPHLKVRFVDDNGGKIGSLLSQDVYSIPEPSILLIFGIGLVALGLASLHRKV